MVFCSLSACSHLVPRAFDSFLRFCFPAFTSIRSAVSIPPLSGFLSADEDTTQYLSEALAVSSQDQRPRSVTEVKNALEETRTRKETMELGFEDRVSAALSILGVS